MSTASPQVTLPQTANKEDRRRWPVVALLSFGMINAYFDRVCLSVAIPFMISSVAMTETEKGWALGAFFITYTLLQIPSGVLVDRYGVRNPYIYGYLLWSFASAGTALTSSLVFLMVVRLLLGIGESVVTPSSMRYIRLHFDEEDRGKAVGLYMTGTKLGPAFGFLLAGWLIAEFGWEVMFLVMGIGGLVFLIPWMAWVKKEDIAAVAREKRLMPMIWYFTATGLATVFGVPLLMNLARTVGWLRIGIGLVVVAAVVLGAWYSRRARRVAATDRVEEAGLGALGAEHESKLATLPTAVILKSPALWGVLLGTFCYMYFVYYSMQWMPSYLKDEFDMSLKEMSWFPFVGFGGMAVIIWVGGYLADQMIKRGRDPINVRKAFTILGFLFASTQTFGVFTDNLDWKLFFAIFSLVGLGFATANYWALTQTLIPGGSIAMVVGIQNTAANLAGFVAGPITGWLVDQTGSFDAPIKFVGFWLVLGIAGYIFLVRRKYAPKIETA
jgi:MFS family permease